MTEVEQILAWQKLGPIESKKQSIIARLYEIIKDAERLEHEKPTEKVPLFSMHARRYDGGRATVVIQPVIVKNDKSRWANSRYNRLFSLMDEKPGHASDINWGQHG